VEYENNIKFDSIETESKYFLLGDTANPSGTLIIKYIYPIEYADRDILQKMQTRFLTDFFGESYKNVTPQEAINSYSQKYIADYKSLEKHFLRDLKKSGEKFMEASWYSYYENSSNSIVYNKNNIISYIISINYYKGGAHESSGYVNKVIDLKTGNLLTENDIFVPDYQEPLAKIIHETIAENFKAAPPEELENMGFFNVNEIYPNDNFIIDSVGVTYTYNIYEIAAYAVGKIDVKLPFDKIRFLLRKDSRLTLSF
jgi:hypothetical protein